MIKKQWLKPIDAMMTEKLAEEIAEFQEDRKQLAKLKQNMLSKCVKTPDPNEEICCRITCKRD